MREVLRNSELSFQRDRGSSFLQVIGSRSAIEVIFQDKELKQLIASTSQVSPVNQIKIFSPDGEEFPAIPVVDFAEFFDLEEIEHSCSLDYLSNLDETIRLKARAQLCLNNIEAMACVISHEFYYQAAQDRPSFPMHVNPCQIIGLHIEEVLPESLASSFAHTLQTAFQFQEQEHWWEHDVFTSGIRHRFLTKIVAYGGSHGEALITTIRHPGDRLKYLNLLVS